MDAIDEAVMALEQGDEEKALAILKKATAPEPLPCPCCGSVPELHSMGLLWYVQCPECGLRTLADDLRTSIGVWNRRAGKTE